MISIHWPKIFTTVFLFFIILFYGYGIWQLRDDFSKPFQPAFFAKLYEYSQFGAGKLVISDEDLYAYSGYTYLTTGDISRINIEHPPLGKYLIGLSIVWFQNQLMINLLWGALLLFLSWKISIYFFQLFPNLTPKTKPTIYWLASLTPTLIILEPMFWDHMTKSLLDLPVSVAALGFIYLHLTLPDSFKYRSLCLGIMLGMVASIKFPALAIILFFAWAASELYPVLKNKNVKWIKQIFQVGLIAVVIYSFCYLPLFIQAGILGVFMQHLQALKIHLSHVPEYRPGAIIQVLLLNSWPQWYGKDESLPAPTWNWTWPVFLLTFVYTPILVWHLHKHLLARSWIVFVFPWLYFGFLSIRLFFPNYMLILIPFFSIYFTSLLAIGVSSFPRLFSKDML